MWRLQRAHGDPTFAQLTRAREYTQRMKEQGQLRGSRLAKVADFFKRYPTARAQRGREGDSRVPDHAPQLCACEAPAELYGLHPQS